MSDMFGSFQGEIFLADRDVNGNPTGPFESIGDANVFDVGNSIEELRVKESISGFRKTVRSIVTSQENTFTINFRNINAVNFAIMALGIVVDVASATITDEVFPTVAVGDILFLDEPGKISALTLVDSTGSPVTLVDGTHFIQNGYGKITIISLTGLTQPIKASSYTAASIKKVPIQTQNPPEKYLRFEGVNTVEFNTDGSFKRVRLDYYKARFKPAESMSWLQENDVASIPVTGDFLSDDTKVASSTQSTIGELIYLDS